MTPLHNETDPPGEKRAAPANAGTAPKQPHEIFSGVSEFTEDTKVRGIRSRRSKLAEKIERLERAEREQSRPGYAPIGDVVDFDHAAVERELGESVETPEPHAEGLEFLQMLLHRGPKVDTSATPVRRAALSYVAVCFLFRVDFMAGETLQTIAKQMGMSPEGFRAYVTWWSEAFDILPPRAKSEEGRARYSAAQLRHYARVRAEKEAA